MGVINLFGIIGEGDPFFGGGGVSVQYVTEKLAEMADEKEITVRISSYGGDVDQGETIYNLLKASGKTIRVEIVGQCYSIATVIAMAGDEIYTAKNSRWMVHPAWTPYAQGNADQLEEIADALRTRSEQIYGYYLNRVSEDKREKLREYFDAETELTAEQVIELGLADGLLEDVKNLSLPMPFKAVAYVKSIPMTNNKSILDKIEAMFNKYFPKAEAPAEVLNASLETNEGTLYYDGDLAVGTAVFSDEAMTAPAADGVYTTADQVVTVAGGAVSEIAGVEMPEDTAELDALKAELAAANEAKASAEAKVTEVETAMNALKAELDEVKNMAINLGKPNRVEAAGGVRKISAAGVMAEVIKNKKTK